MDTQPENNFLINWTASCTREQAVLYFFSIGRSIIYDREIESNPEHEPFLEYDLRQRHDLTLDEYWRAKYKEKLTELNSEISPDTPEQEHSAIVESRHLSLQTMEKMIGIARNVLIDIVDEISKGADSKLRIDQEMTKKTGVEHITIKSLKEWYDARERDSETGSLAEQIVALMDRERGEFTQTKSPREMPKSQRSLYTTLALCLDSHAKDLGKPYRNDNGDLNIAKLSEVIHAHSLTLKDDFPDQSIQSIRNRLSLARECMKEVLRN